MTGKVTGFITDLKGKVEKEETWGRRKLAYPINKQDFATYVTLFFVLPADKVKEFDHEMRLTAQIIRHLLLVKDYGTEEITLSADEIAATEEIEEVIGGEKSFEVVEGETEESIDLNAVREKDEVIIEEITETTSVEETVEESAKEETEEEKTEVVEETEEKVKEEVVPEKEEETTPNIKKTTKKKEVSDEAERLSKLNEELDDILKDEL